MHRALLTLNIPLSCMLFFIVWTCFTLSLISFVKRASVSWFSQFPWVLSSLSWFWFERFFFFCLFRYSTLYRTYVPVARLSKLLVWLLSYAAPYWATPHPTEPRRTLLSYTATTYWATPHPTEPRRTLLSFAAPYWVMPHTNDLLCTLLKLNNVACRRLARSLLCSTSTLRGGCCARDATVSLWTSTTPSSETSSGSLFPVYQVLMVHNWLVIVWTGIVYCSVADPVFIESGSRSRISSQSGSGSKVLMTKSWK